MDSRTKKSEKNIFAALVNRVILLILPFILRTVMVRVLGSSFLGLNTLFTSILSVLSLTELGFGAALVFSMYEPISKDNKNKLCALLNLYKKIYTLIGVIILFAGTVVIPFIPRLINAEVPENINIYVLYFLFLLNTAFSYLCLAYKRALLIAHQRNDVISNINTIVSILMYSAQIFILYSMKNYYVYILLFVLFGILENIFISIRASKLYPDIKCIGHVQRDEYHIIAKNVIGIALQKICSASRNSFDSIIISINLGLLDVAKYGNYYTVMNAVHVLLCQIPNSIRASVGDSIVSESKHKNFEDFRKFNYLYMWICGICMCCMLCLFQPFMRIWMGANNLFSTYTLILFCIYFYELSLTDILYVYRDAAGLWWFGRYATIIEVVLNLILNFVFGFFWGVNGVLISTIVTVLGITIGYYGFLIFKNYFGVQHIYIYLKDSFCYILLTFLSAIFSYLISCHIKFIGIGSLIIIGFFSLIITNSIYWIILRKHPCYQYAKKILVSIIKKK